MKSRLQSDEIGSNSQSYLVREVVKRLKNYFVRLTCRRLPLTYLSLIRYRVMCKRSPSVYAVVHPLECSCEMDSRNVTLLPKSSRCYFNPVECVFRSPQRVCRTMLRIVKLFESWNGEEFSHRNTIFEQESNEIDSIVFERLHHCFVQCAMRPFLAINENF